MPVSFSKRLLSWYEKYGRHDLPWQKNPTPYRVWISEIMLQQTQVTTVIPYYARFMKRFPSIRQLAHASQDEVLSHWSGLGYYARARNIHKTAQIIHENFKGRFPDTVERICELPGIGKSTAGAIVSFSMQKKAVILDGNVKRVLARYYAIDKPINQTKTIDELWVVAEKLTPTVRAHHYNQAMMDLGATLCTRSKPRCMDCPMTRHCAAHQAHASTAYPKKTPKKARPIKKIRMLIICNPEQAILLLKRPQKGIWGGLWSFPELDLQQSYTRFEHDQTAFPLQYIDELEKITHQFTHFTLEIFPMLVKTNQRALSGDTTDMIWYTLTNTLPGGIAAPVATLLSTLRERHETHHSLSEIGN